MVEQKLSIRDQFPPVDYDTWRKIAEDSLKGASFEKKLVTHTYEGIDLQPIYTLADRLEPADATGMPGMSPFVRGATALGASSTGWDLRQEHALPEPDQFNEAVLEDLAGGITSLHVVLDRAVQAGFDADHAEAKQLATDGGLLAFQFADFKAALENVQLEIAGISLESGAAYIPTAALLAALWKQQSVDKKTVTGAFNADPLKELALSGELPYTLESAFAQLSNLAKWTTEHYPSVTSIGVDTSPYHHAGATAAQDLGFAMATALEYLRVLLDSGLEINQATPQMLFRISLGTHHFLAISKLRAARRLWGRVVEVLGGDSESAGMKVHARLSDRVQTRKDPYVNLLRNTVGVFSAGVGGATSITSVPFDYATGQTDKFSRRIARNTGLVLQEEAHLHKVIDPAGGSWFLEKLTDQLAEKAWEFLQEIERQGGMSKALLSGWVAEQIDSAFAPRAKDIASRKEGITGVSEFPNISEEKIDHQPTDPETLKKQAIKQIAANRKTLDSLAGLSCSSEISAVVDAAHEGATIGQMAEALGFHAESTSIAPIEAHSFAEPYEELRDASDAWQLANGHRPLIFLANMGPIAHHTARATYSKSFFEAGGFEVLSNEGFQDSDSAIQAFKESGASIAVICSSDKLYPDYVPDVSAKLKTAGARTVVLAGRPGDNEDNWRAAGVDRFIYISCDVLGTLREMLEEEGVLSA